MAEHLMRRGGVWWARLVVPSRLREAAGRREFIQSCRTSELHITKLVCSVLVSKCRRLLLALESAYAPQSNLDEYLNRDFRTQLRSADRCRTQGGLLEKAAVFMQFLVNSPERVKSYFQHDSVAYAA